MYRFSMIAMAVGALALLSAGSALAAQHEGMKGLSIGGSMNAGIEMVDSGSASQIGVQSEAVLDFSAASGPVSMKFRIEANDNSTTLDNVRNQIKWQVTDGFSMTISGMSFGETATIVPFGASTVGQFTPFGSVAGHRASVTQYVFGVNQPSADFRFAFGSSNAGLVLNPRYNLDGNVVKAATPTDAAAAKKADTTPATETMTLSPYFNGQFGAIGVNFMHTIASGKMGTGQTVDPEASETSVAVTFKGGAFSAVLQIAPGTYTDGVTGDEHTTQAINVGVKASGISFHYVTETDDNDTTSAVVEDNVDIALAYSSAINEKASWTVGYAQNTEGSADPVTVLAFGLGLNF
jgi:hypothetical protein